VLVVLAAPYLPRRPQETVLYELVKTHWSDFVEHARGAYEAPLPKYVRDEVRGYLACGDFSRGFVHTTCTTCSRDLLVAFSCKQRGLCPSCAGRRMAAGAAHLVDRILPSAPVRQYVLSFPYELSGLAAIRPDVLTALSRIFWQALRLRYRRWAKGAGYSSSEAGAVTGVQRFGSSLNVHVHFHLLALDGVYVKEQGGLRFVPAPPPVPGELLAMLVRIHKRAMKWLSRRGYLRDPDASNAAPELGVAEALTAAGAQQGRLVTMSEEGGEQEVQERGARPAEEAVTHERFNLHAGVVLAADDDMGRERLCRYLLRPPFALSRIRVLRDGNVSYRVKKVGRRQAKHRVMTPVEFLARLCALVPPPRYPLLRFAGVLAPRHEWRARVVPQPPELPSAPPRCSADCGATEHRPLPKREPPVATGDGACAFAVPEALPTQTLTESGHAERAGPNILSVAHWQRLLGGELYASSSRVDWATLLKRTWGTDVRVCVRCGGRLVVRAVVTDPHSVGKLLTALRRSRDPPLAAA